MARDYAALSPKDQRSTIVIDPSRAGRDALSAAIRIQLVASGRLTGETVTMRTLESKGLTKAEARDARSYEVGDVLRFARDYVDKGIAKREAVTVKTIDPAKNAVSLEKAGGQAVDWRPRQWGASKSEAFSPGSIELTKSDRIEFTRNDRAVTRENGGAAQIISVKPLASGSTAASSRYSTSIDPPTSTSATAMSKLLTPPKAAPPSAS